MVKLIIELPNIGLRQRHSRLYFHQMTDGRRYIEVANRNQPPPVEVRGLQSAMPVSDMVTITY